MGEVIEWLRLEFKNNMAKLSDIELAEMAHKEISNLAKTGGKSFKMCVPPEITDSDMLLSELVTRFEKNILGGMVEEKSKL